MSRIAIGSDHAGFLLKEHFIEVLKGAGLEVIDHGTHSTESVDYPPICSAVAQWPGSVASDIDSGTLPVKWIAGILPPRR